MTFFLDGPPPPTRSADRAQEAVVVGLGLVQLGREVAGEALETAREVVATAATIGRFLWRIG